MDKKTKLTMPHVYLLITLLIFAAGILTYIVPAGVYDFVEVEGRKIVDPATFHYLEEATPVPDRQLSLCRSFPRWHRSSV